MTLFVNKSTKKNKLNLSLFFNEKVNDKRLFGKSITVKYNDDTYLYAIEDIMEWVQNNAVVDRIVADRDLIPQEWIDKPFYEGRNITVRIWTKEDFKRAYCSKEA